MLLTTMLAVAVQALAPLPSPPPSHDPWLIFFEKDTIEIVGDGQTVLANVPAAFNSKDALCIELIGHADFNEGSEEQKQQLSQARAETTKRILVANGISAAAVRFRGEGDRHPITDRPHAYNQFVSIDFCPATH